MAVCAGSSSTILRESRSYRLWSSGPTNPTTKQEKAAPSRQIITAELCGNEVALHELLSGWVICLHMLVYATHDFNHNGYTYSCIPLGIVFINSRAVCSVGELIK